MSGKPNITLVARRAGVAKSTVSRVLNGGSASVEVRDRVQHVIEQLGYKPLTTARNLALGQAGCIGLVVGNTRGSWFTQLLGGVEEELAQYHISVLLGSLELSGRYDARTVESWIEQRRVDGIVFCRPMAAERPLLDAANRAGLVLSLIAPDEDFGVGHILCSRNRDAGRLAADHLWSLGHRNFAFIGGPKCARDTTERLKGVQEALSRWDAKIPARNIRFADYVPSAGHDFAERWVSLPRSQAPTALIFGNDELALGFMRTAQLRGVRIPSEVSVVGFDDAREASLTYPGLTTIRQETRAIGAAACRSLLERLDHPAQRLPPMEFPMSLVVRESTSSPPQ